MQIIFFLYKEYSGVEMVEESESEEKDQEPGIEYGNSVRCESLSDEDDAVTVDVNHFTTIKSVPVCYTVDSS